MTRKRGTGKPKHKSHSRPRKYMFDYDFSCALI